MAQCCFQSLAKSDNFLMEGAAARRFAVFGSRLLVSVESVFLNFSCGYLGDAQVYSLELPPFDARQADDSSSKEQQPALADG